MQRMLPVILIAFGLVPSGGLSTMVEIRFHGITLVDPANPVPAEWLQRAGIDYVYTSGTLDLETGPDGAPRLPQKEQAGWERLQAEYGGTGIKVLIMSNYYAHNPDGTDAYDCEGNKIEMACLQNDQFYAWMADTITAQAKAYSAYSVFGGFAFDDGWGVRVDCDYCDTCTRLFKERYGKEPPAFEVHEGTGVVDDDDLLLQWEQFQREGLLRYPREQSRAVRSVSEDLAMYTIPSDSYYYGRLLNANMQQADLPRSASALIQRIERTQVKNWFIFQAFPFPRVPEADEQGLQHFAVGCHFTANSPKLVLCTEGPFLQSYNRTQMMSPDEIAQMARITITEGGEAICYWCSGSMTAEYPEGFDGMEAAYRDVTQLQQLLAVRTPAPTEVGLLYSTTTEVFEQPWESNLSERWAHLHSFEATAFALLRGNVAFRIVMEDDLSASALDGLDAVVLPNVRFLSASAHETIMRAAADGTAVLAAGECVDIEGAHPLDYDVTFWHRMIMSGYRLRSNMDAHYQEAERGLLPLLRSLVDQEVTVSSPTGISRLYDLPRGKLMMIANWDLKQATWALIAGESHYRVTDALTGGELGDIGDGGTLTIPIAPADWRVLVLE